MEQLEIYDHKDVELKEHLVRIGDIINLDGPVLSLFQDNRSEELFLFDWVDSDEHTNRWLIYEIAPEILNDFLNRKISYRIMFESSLIGSFYFADIVNSENIDYSIGKLKYLPKNYITARDVFLDINDIKDFDKIIGTVQNILEKTKKTNTQANKISYNFNFFLSQAQERFERLQEEPKVIELDTKIVLSTLDEQNYVIPSNRLPKRERMGLLHA